MKATTSMKKTKNRNFVGSGNPVLSALAAIVLAAGLGAATSVYAQGLADMKAHMQKQMKIMKPELKEKVKSLSMDTKMSMMAIMAMHSRNSDKATLRQVMIEVLHDYQGMVTGIMTENVEMTADSARRLANHRIPRGGLLAYIGLDNITDEKLASLDGFNTAVEGGAKRIAEAAEAGDFATAGAVLGEMATGCVNCHKVFREYPGKSDLLMD